MVDHWSIHFNAEVRAALALTAGQLNNIKITYREQDTPPAVLAPQSPSARQRIEMISTSLVYPDMQ